MRDFGEHLAAAQQREQPLAEPVWVGGASAPLPLSSASRVADPVVGEQQV